MYQQCFGSSHTFALVNECWPNVLSCGFSRRAIIGPAPAADGEVCEWRFQGCQSCTAKWRRKCKCCGKLLWNCWYISTTSTWLIRWLIRCNLTSYNPGQPLWYTWPFFLTILAFPPPPLVQCWISVLKVSPFEQHCMGGRGKGQALENKLLSLLNREWWWKRCKFSECTIIILLPRIVDPYPLYVITQGSTNITILLRLSLRASCTLVSLARSYF